MMISVLRHIGVLCFFAASQAYAFTDALSLYDQTTAIVSDKFYDQTFRGLPWSDFVKTYRQQLSPASSEKELKFVTNDLLSNLKASHTKFLSDSDQEFHALKSVFSHTIEGNRLYQIGAWFVRINERWFIRAIFPGGPADKAGLVRGDEIISVNERALEPVHSFIDGHTVRVAYRRISGGRIRYASVPPSYESFQESLLRGTLASKRVIELNGKRIGYFHLWSGTHERFLEATQQAARELESTTDAMIFDLRDGFGGAYPKYAEPFFAEDLTTGGSIPRLYSKPIVVLINDGVRSGKEWVAHLLKAKHRGPLIGSTTGGQFLAGELFDIVKDRFALYLAVEFDPTMPNLEGKGVSPDIIVPAPVPFAQGADPELQAALEYLAK